VVPKNSNPRAPPALYAAPGRAGANHYLVSQDAHTAAEIVARTRDRFACAAEDCVLFMWTTVPYLAVAIDVLRQRGFRYVSHYAWGKTKTGTGHWNRNKHELLLIGVKGTIPGAGAGDAMGPADPGRGRRALGKAGAMR
jgi:N6-adenosine-specific RNA methylase IME4